MLSITELFSDADDAFFERILTNSEHVLQPFLPEKPDLSYNLRERTHNRSLIIKTVDLSERNFVVRMLYKELKTVTSHCLYFIFLLLSCVWLDLRVTVAQKHYPTSGWNRPPKLTAVDFDLTWLHLTVACDLSWLQTTSQVQKFRLTWYDSNCWVLTSEVIMCDNVIKKPKKPRFLKATSTALAMSPGCSQFGGLRPVTNL